MHILICSYEFGYAQGPEGLCVMRLAHALLDAGVRVTVVASRDADEGKTRPGLEVIKVRAEPFPPKPLFRNLERALGRLYFKNHHQFWQRRVLRTKLPRNVDVIYGRCMPFSSGLAAQRLADKLHLPLMVHFSDPLLSPWYTPPPLPLYLMRRLYMKVVSRAQAISFVTQEAIAYSERTMQVSLHEKAFVLNHVAPAAHVFGPRHHRADPRFLYAGRFYGRRGPRVLLEGFAIHLKSHPSSEFHFVGSEFATVMGDAERLAITNSIAVFPFTPDVVSHFARADILVAIDAADETPVFLSTKIVDYFLVDRLVLLVTPANSPAEQLAKKAPGTAFAVRENSEAIAAAMNDLATNGTTERDYRQRFKMMREFSGEAVAKSLVASAERCLDVAREPDRGSVAR